MGFDYKTLSLESITALPIKVKEAFPEESKKWDGLTRGVIEIWLKHEEKFLEIEGVRYKLTPQNK